MASSSAFIDIWLPFQYRHRAVSRDASRTSSVLVQENLGEPAMHTSATNHDWNQATPSSGTRRRWLFGALSLMLLGGIALSIDPARAQTPAPVKLYILDLGQLKSGNPQPLLDRGVTITDMSVVAYLIVHPRGT